MCLSFALEQQLSRSDYGSFDSLGYHTDDRAYSIEVETASEAELREYLHSVGISNDDMDMTDYDGAILRDLAQNYINRGIPFLS